MRYLLLLAAGLLAPSVFCGCESGEPVAVVQGVDLKGRSVNPFAGEAEITVLVFVGCDCPISNRYIPTLRSLREQYKQELVRFWLVYPDPDVSAEEIRRHLAEFVPDIPALRDPRHELVRAAGATTVPEAAVFVTKDPRHIVSYHGSIDDRFVDFGVARPHATKHHLRKALELVLADRDKVLPSLPAIGCPIPGVR